MFSNRRLLVQSSLFYFPKLLTWVGSYLAFSLLFRLRGAAEYGDYILIFAYWGIPAMIAGDIVGTSGQKLLAEASVVGQDALRKAFQSVWRVHFICLLAVGVLGALLLPFMNRTVFENPSLGEHLWLGVGVYLGSASLGFFRYALRGMQMYKQCLAMDLSESLLRSLLWIACCLGFAFGLSLTGAAALALLLAAAVVYLSLFFRGIMPGGGSLEVEHGKEIAFQAKAMSLIFICSYALNSFPAIVLNRFHGAESVGLYSALFRIVDFSSGPIMALAFILAPTASGAKLKGEHEVRELLSKSFKVYIFFLPFVAAMAICRSEIVNLFGLGKYEEAPAIILAFCFWVVFSNISAIFGAFADFLGYARARAHLMMGFSTVFCGVTLYYSKYGSLLQVAWGTTISYAILVSSYLGLIVYHHSGQFIRQNLNLLVRVMACVFLAAVVAKYWLPSPQATGIRENVQSLLLRTFSFGGLTVAFGALIVFRRENGRLTIRKG